MPCHTLMRFPGDPQRALRLTGACRALPGAFTAPARVVENLGSNAGQPLICQMHTIPGRLSLGCLAPQPKRWVETRQWLRRPRVAETKGCVERTQWLWRPRGAKHQIWVETTQWLRRPRTANKNKCVQSSEWVWRPRGRNKSVALKLRSGRDDHEAKKIHVLKVRSGCGDQGVRKKHIHAYIYI